jgi:hypothetical protein
VHRLPSALTRLALWQGADVVGRRRLAAPIATVPGTRNSACPAVEAVVQDIDTSSLTNGSWSGAPIVHTSPSDACLSARAGNSTGPAVAVRSRHESKVDGREVDTRSSVTTAPSSPTVNGTTPNSRIVSSANLGILTACTTISRRPAHFARPTGDAASATIAWVQPGGVHTRAIAQLFISSAERRARPRRARSTVTLTQRLAARRHSGCPRLDT